MKKGHGVTSDGKTTGPADGLAGKGLRTQGTRNKVQGARYTVNG
jgi:hypothetical protein